MIKFSVHLFNTVIFAFVITITFFHLYRTYISLPLKTSIFMGICVIGFYFYGNRYSIYLIPSCIVFLFVVILYLNGVKQRLPVKVNTILITLYLNLLISIIWSFAIGRAIKGNRINLIYYDYIMGILSFLSHMAMLPFLKHLSILIHSYSVEVSMISCMYKLIIIFYYSIGLQIVRILYDLPEIYFQIVHIFLPFVAICCLFIFRFISQKETESSAMKMQLEDIELHYKEVDALSKKTTETKHSIKTMVDSLIVYYVQDDYEGFKKHFSLVMDLYRGLAIQDLPLENIKNDIVKNYLFYSFIQAQKMGIEIQFEIPSSIPNIHMETVDLVNVLGIYITNALESAIREYPVLIQLENEESIYIHIENVFAAYEFSLNQLEQQGFSTKGTGRGNGRQIAHSILDKYENIEYGTAVQEFLDTKYQNKYKKFVQEITIGKWGF